MRGEKHREREWVGIITYYTFIEREGELWERERVVEGSKIGISNGR